MRNDLKSFFVVLLIGASVPMFLFGLDFYFKEYGEIQLHDTYIVFNPFEFALIPIASIFFSVFLVRAIRLKFQKQSTNIFLVFAAALTIVIIGEIYKLFAQLSAVT